MLSLTVAAVVTAIASMTLNSPDLMGASFSGGVKSNTLFVIFVVAFLFTATPTSFVYLGKERLSGGFSKKKDYDPDEDLFFDIDDLDFGGSEAEDEDAAQQAPEAQTPEPEPEPAEAPVLEPEAEADVPLTTEQDEQRKNFLRFLAEALAVLQATKQRLDSYEKFGVNLFMAGACETLAQEEDLDDAAMAKILGQGLELMGMTPDQASAFLQRYEGYLLGDPRYLRMFDAGREAMNTTLSGGEGSEDALNISLEGWNAPQDENMYSGPLTVLFTDIAGSTALTQEMGDSGAQVVVRAHNTIVRSALGRYGGREIKHTGDGIMASFVKTSASVEAAIQMQMETETFTRENPQTPLHLKIGINAGEPIAEDDDLFGSMVQMSARIVDKAQADEIMVSDVVRALCAGNKDLRFANRGSYDMKGFDGPTVLYEIIWNDQKAAAMPPELEPPAEPAPAEMPPAPETAPESAPAIPTTEVPAPAAETTPTTAPDTPAAEQAPKEAS